MDLASIHEEVQEQLAQGHTVAEDANLYVRGSQHHLGAAERRSGTNEPDGLAQNLVQVNRREKNASRVGKAQDLPSYP